MHFCKRSIKTLPVICLTCLSPRKIENATLNHCTAVINNKVRLFKNVTIAVTVSKIKTDIFIAIVLMYSHWNLL